MAAPASAVTPDTLITIKISVNDVTKKLKLPLRDLGVSVLPAKLRQVLGIKPEQYLVLERFSDSSNGFIALDEDNAQVFKTLIRAAKAKLKLRLKATVIPAELPKPDSEHREHKEVAANTAEQRNIGSGIFQFRDARAPQQTLSSNDEAPVPSPFTSSRLSLNLSSSQNLAIRAKEPALPANAQIHAWSVYCNECDKAMSDQHFHCSICDGGDYDLCEGCVSNGKMCPGDDHWLVKRFIQDGKVLNSTTERVSSRKPEPTAQGDADRPSPSTAALDPAKDIPGAFTDETKTLAEEPRMPTRTCNCCVVVLPEREFVTCKTCDDFDLCLRCHGEDVHGHHPAHSFMPTTDQTLLSSLLKAKLAPGRNVVHHAICDGCNKTIHGVRHKCLTCPDWDYCNDCVKQANSKHPGHRFAPLYEPITEQRLPIYSRHVGVMCDGPLCAEKPSSTYIQGVRYKCTICHDTDFCASCEAHPGAQHNRTHPLLKIKTPVRNVCVSTENEVQGQVRYMGDRRQKAQSKTAEKASASQANSATAVQTVAEIKPTESKKEEAVEIPATPLSAIKAPAAEAHINSTLLKATYVNDSVTDGAVFQPEARFTQVWTMKNPGPYAWPAGCSVRYVGGDNMLNVDNTHPSSVSAIAQATESNVIAREVQVGEEVAFKVTLKAPVREGKSISYWRVKAPDGTPFGHRLWCDIKIEKSIPAELSQQKIETPEPSKNETSSGVDVASSAYTVMMERIKMHQAALRAKQQQQQLQQQRLQQQELQAKAQLLMHQQQRQQMLNQQDVQYQQRLQQQQQQQLQQYVQQQRSEQGSREKATGVTQDRIFQQQQQNLAELRKLSLQKAQVLQEQAKSSYLPPSPYATYARANFPSCTPPQQSEVSPSPSPSASVSAFSHPGYGFSGISGYDVAAAFPNGFAPQPAAALAGNGMQYAPRMDQRRAQHDQRRDQMIAYMKAHNASSPAPVDPSRPTDEQSRTARLTQIKENMRELRAARETAIAAEKGKSVVGSSDDDEKVQKILLEHAKNTTEQKKAEAAAAVEEAKTDAEEELAGSQMVFPKLDKESPASSPYQSMTSSVQGKGKAAYVENEEGEVERSAAPAPVAAAPSVASTSEDYQDLDDDIEVLSATGDESDEEDDGFVTDEEYDILDASDEETVA